MLRSQSKIDILSLNLDELTENVCRLGVQKYRALQIFDWLHKKNVKSFCGMTNLPKSLRELLEQNFAIISVENEKKLISKIDGTEKHLFKLHDGALVETVVMDYSFGKSVCISTQAGCRMNCVFCASGETGLVRNLTAGEMLAQVYDAASPAPTENVSAHEYNIIHLNHKGSINNNAKIKRIVLMGCGEPLDNFENVLRFLELISHEKGRNIGQRNITLSTCGIVPKIYELAKLGMQINLAVSLHAPTNDIRKKLMPISKAYPLDELIASAKHYADATKRRVTYEYSLIDGMNDEISHAEKLAGLLSDSLCHINLIPVNNTSCDMSPSKPNKIASFCKTLESHGIQTTIRRSIGNDINAACGQLRGSRKKF